MVDQGGLNYRILIEDAFSQALKAFREQVQAASADTRDFKAAKDKAFANDKAIQKQVEQMRAQATATRQLSNEMKLVGESTQKLNRPQNRPVKQVQDFKALRQAIFDTAHEGNRLVFTLRNIIGVGAGLAAIQKVQQGFSDLVKSGVDFNIQLENTQTEITAIILSATQISNAFSGEVLTGAQAYTAAAKIAADQTEELKQAAIATGADLGKLGTIFRTALSVGIPASVSINDIRKISVGIQQAAEIFGIEQDKLQAEIRSLFTGVINERSSKLIKALGINARDIEEAKRSVGGLASFLQGKLASIASVTVKADSNFARLKDQLVATVSNLTGVAANPLFNKIKSLFKDVIDSVSKTDIAGKIVPDPRALQVAEVFFNSLTDSVQEMVAGVKALSFADVLASARAFGAVVTTVAQVVTGFIQGAVAGFSDLRNVLVKVFGENSLNPSTIRRIAAAMGEVLVVATSLSAIMGGLGFIIKGLISPIVGVISVIKVAGEGVKFIGLTWKKILPLITSSRLLSLGLVGALVGAAFVLKEIFDLENDIKTIREGAQAENQLNALGALQSKLKDLKKEFEETAAFNDAHPLLGSNTKIIQLSQDINKVTKDIIRMQKETKAAGGNVALGLKGPKDTKDLEKRLNDVMARMGALAEEGGAEAGDDFSESFAGSIATNTFLGFTIDDFISPELQEQFANLGQKLVVNLTPKETEETAFVKRFKDMSDSAKLELDILANSVQEFSNFAGDAIVDAFDPTKDSDDIKAAFASLLQSIAKMIISTLVQIAIAKALLGIASGGGSNLLTSEVPFAAGGGLVPGFAEGGAVLSPAHYGIDAPPPASVAASDTVPAWLSPGEFIQRASAVATYGADFMDALNKRMIDPSSLRAFAGLKGRRYISPARSLGHASGGLIGPTAGAVGGGGSSSQPGVAIVAGNDKSVDRMLRGGKAGLRRLVQEMMDSGSIVNKR